MSAQTLDGSPAGTGLWARYITGGAVNHANRRGGPA